MIHRWEVYITRGAEGKTGKAFVGNMTEEKSVELASKIASEGFVFAVRPRGGAGWQGGLLPAWHGHGLSSCSSHVLVCCECRNQQSDVYSTSICPPPSTAMSGGLLCLGCASPSEQNVLQSECRSAF